MTAGLPTDYQGFHFEVYGWKMFYSKNKVEKGRKGSTYS
jgi:hypothetical protein